MPCFIVRNENKNLYDILERCVISVKKISVKSAALIAGAAALLTFSVTSFWAFQICSDSVATLRKKAKSIEDIYTVDQYIDEYYYGSYDEEIIVDQALKGMVSALDDKYSAYMTPDEYEQNLIDAKGSITGIGITVNKGDNNEIKIETKNSRNDPIKGILNAVITISVIMQVRHIAITSGGIVFPSRISKEVSGLTISWSKVPISLSLAIERAVSSKVITRASIATITVKMYHLYSRLGLYQLRILGAI